MLFSLFLLFCVVIFVCVYCCCLSLALSVWGYLISIPDWLFFFIRSAIKIFFNCWYQLVVYLFQYLC